MSNREQRIKKLEQRAGTNTKAQAYYASLDAAAKAHAELIAACQALERGEALPPAERTREGAAAAAEILAKLDHLASFANSDLHKQSEGE